MTESLKSFKIPRPKLHPHIQLSLENSNSTDSSTSCLRNKRFKRTTGKFWIYFSLIVVLYLILIGIVVGILIIPKNHRAKHLQDININFDRDSSLNYNLIKGKPIHLTPLDDRIHGSSVSSSQEDLGEQLVVSSNKKYIRPSERDPIYPLDPRSNLFGREGEGSEEEGNENEKENEGKSIIIDRSEYNSKFLQLD